MTEVLTQIAFQNLPQDDPRQRRPDITLAIETFGWAPQVTLDQGLPWVSSTDPMFRARNIEA